MLVDYCCVAFKAYVKYEFGLGFFSINWRQHSNFNKKPNLFSWEIWQKLWIITSGELKPTILTSKVKKSSFLWNLHKSSFLIKLFYVKYVHTAAFAAIIQFCESVFRSYLCHALGWSNFCETTGSVFQICTYNCIQGIELPCFLNQSYDLKYLCSKYGRVR